MGWPGPATERQFQAWRVWRGGGTPAKAPIEAVKAKWFALTGYDG